MQAASMPTITKDYLQIRRGQESMKRFIDLNVGGGGTTDVARPIKARYGAIGHQEYVPKHKGESSGVIEETVKIRDGTSKGFSEVPIGGVVDTAIPNSKTRRGRVQDNGQTKIICKPCLTPNREEKRQNGRRFKEDGEEAFTVNTQDRHGVLLDDGRKIKIRKLTPKECFRLQGWTDDYFEKAQFVNSDSQLYKQAGNGVTVPVIEAIARRFKDA